MTRETLIRTAALVAGAFMATFVLLGARGIGQVALFPGPYLDKLAHGTYYGIMAALFDRGFSLRLPILAVALAATVGAADEIHQIYVPGRDASVFDWLADLTGGIALSLAARRTLQRPSRRRET